MLCEAEKPDANSFVNRPQQEWGVSRGAWIWSLKMKKVIWEWDFAV